MGCSRCHGAHAAYGVKSLGTAAVRAELVEACWSLESSGHMTITSYRCCRVGSHARLTYTAVQARSFLSVQDLWFMVCKITVDISSTDLVEELIIGSRWFRYMASAWRSSYVHCSSEA